MAPTRFRSWQIKERIYRVAKSAGRLVAGLAISVLIGIGAELFLSEGARRKALAFQSRMLEELGTFTPLGILDGIRAGFADLSRMRFSNPLEYVIAAPVTTMHELDRMSLIALPALWVVAALALAAGLYTAWLLHRRLGNDPRGTFAMLYVPVSVAAGSFIGALAVISIGLWCLQMLGHGSLVLFGKVTGLAAVFANSFAVAGTAYFVFVKAIEKRIEGAFQRVIEHLLPQRQ